MPRPGTSARRYAEAAFQIADRDGTIDAWREALDAAARTLGEEEVARVLENPGRPLREREAVVAQALRGSNLPQLHNLVLLLLRRGRVELLPAVADEFRRLYNERNGIVAATATSAVALSADEVRGLTARLEQLTGARVQLSLAVDPAILGGVIVRHGDLLLDGSVRGRLERLRNQLLTSAR